MRADRLFILGIVGALILATSAPARAASFQVTLDTSALTGTQTFGFGLTNSNSAANTVTLGDFAFGGGSPVAASQDCTLGGTLSGLGCSGDLTSGVTLEDLDFTVLFTQRFTVGPSLSFVLTTTNNFAGGTEDQLAMFLCDSAFATCYSDDSATTAMLLLDLSGGSLSPASFIVHGASAQGLPAPIVTAVQDTATVPEPGTLLLLGSALAGAVALGKHRRWFTVRSEVPKGL